MANLMIRLNEVLHTPIGTDGRDDIDFFDLDFYLLEEIGSGLVDNGLPQIAEEFGVVLEGIGEILDSGDQRYV